MTQNVYLNKRVKREATDWKGIHAKHITNNGVVSKIYKDLLTHNSKRTNNPIYKWAKKSEHTPKKI